MIFVEDKKIMTIIDNDNNKHEYEILCTYYLLKTNKNYIIYNDNYDSEDINIYASIFYPDDDTKLDEITTDEEWAEVENRVKEIFGENE